MPMFGSILKNDLIITVRRCRRVEDPWQVGWMGGGGGGCGGG